MSPLEEILEDQTQVIQERIWKAGAKGLPWRQNPFSTKTKTTVGITISELKFYEQWPFKSNNIPGTYSEVEGKREYKLELSMVIS